MIFRMQYSTGLFIFCNSCYGKAVQKGKDLSSIGKNQSLARGRISENTEGVAHENNLWNMMEEGEKYRVEFFDRNRSRKWTKSLFCLQ